MKRYLSHLFVLSIVFVAPLTTLQNCFGQEQSPIAKISSESELIKILEGNSPSGDKAMACKRLAIYGSGKAAPALAKLLTDKELAAWSRIALEAIPGTAPDEALRTAAGGVQGRLLVGVINSIGVRHDRDATDLLMKYLAGSDTDVASAAAIALGNIGGPTASEGLRKALANAPDKVRSSIAEGCVLCAEKFLAEGKSDLAIEIYDQVRAASVPKQRIVEATRGAILARKEAGIPLMLEQLRSTDKVMFQLGLLAARELPGKATIDALIAELDKSSPERAALIVLALADRKSDLDLPTMIKIASKGNRSVRMAAMNAISRIGDATCVAPLLQFAFEKDADLLLPVKEALSQIQDESVNKEIIDRLPKASGDLQQLLIEVTGQRRIEATKELVKAVESGAPSIRKAALESLGSTITQKELPILIGQVVAPKHIEDAAVARQALETAAIRMPDREACASEISKALQGKSVAVKSTLLEVLGAVGGTNALQTLGLAAKDADPQMKDVASRLLGDWMTVDAAPVLLDLASHGPIDKFQVRAMRGYIRIARQFDMKEKERVEMCRQALAAAKQVAEQKLAVEVLSRYPSMGTLKLAIEAIKNPDVKEDATQAAKTIADKLGDKKEVRELMSQAGLAKP